MRCAGYVRVSTEDQKDNGFSIDSQLRMIKEYCVKENYDLIDIYNDAGCSGKDLMRPDMQRLLKDIKAHKIDKLIAIKVDRLTRNNYDGFWLLNYCNEHDVKIELILEPYDVSTANGEMIFGMNLVFGQRERKEIGARTKRALEEMALEKVHPGKAPFGYIRNKETGHLEIEPIRAEIVKEIFNLCKKGYSVRGISEILRKDERYLQYGKWKSDSVYKILINSIYIGILAYGKQSRKKENILYVEDYCESIIDKKLWNATRSVLEGNKHPNYGEHIHLFTNLIKCPTCGKILSSTLSYKYDKKHNQKIYYHLTCKNSNCLDKGLHYSSDKIEKKLGRILNELTRYMYDNTNEIIISNSSASKDLKNIDKAIQKLKIQEKRLVDLYLTSNLNVEAINSKNEAIKKEILKLEEKKKEINPDDINKDYAINLSKKLDLQTDENNNYLFNKDLGFSFNFDSLNRKAKQELLKTLISNIEISRDKNYNIEIKNIKFSQELISKSNKEYLDYLTEIIKNNEIGITYKGMISEEELKELSENYLSFSLSKYENKKYSKSEIEFYKQIIAEHFYQDGIIECPYFDGKNISDRLLLIPKNPVII